MNEKETAVTVSTHNASNISESTYWTIHISSLMIIVVCVIAVFSFKGPRRREALEFLKEQNKK